MLELKLFCSDRLGPIIEPNGFVKKGSLKGVEPPKKLGIRFPGGTKPPKPGKGSPKPKRPPLPPHPLCIFH